MSQKNDLIMLVKKEGFGLRGKRGAVKRMELTWR